LKVLFVSSDDLIGQQFNGYLLMDALRRIGVDARMYVNNTQVDRPGIVYNSRKGLLFINRGLGWLEKQLSLYAILPILTAEIIKNPFYQEADIVHLQLIHASQFFSLLSLPKMGQQNKIVLTLHDPWLSTGHCVYPIECERWKSGCGSCPDLQRPFPIRNDTTAITWKLKNYLMHQTNLHLVVASEWMDELVASSPILSHLPRSIIPFGVDTQVFRPMNKRASKASLGIPEDAFLIAFRAASYSPFKGVEYIEKALLDLDKDTKSKICLVTFDRVGVVPALSNNFWTLELGWVEDQSKIAQVLNASDIFLMPSLAEAFGMMAIESMACGTPVIVFEGTALPSVIQFSRGGITIPSRDWVALRDSIKMVMDDEDLYNRLASNGLKLVEEEYMIEKYVARHVELYTHMMESGISISSMGT
jgi:glycosyltransferase involved in cell wall biosynthesis